jgi:hypothetical protein
MAFLRTPKRLKKLRKSRHRVRFDNDETCVLPEQGIDDAIESAEATGGQRGEK